jgi:alpha-glucosidase (family GH31 glycosyl hydrolase)
MMLISHRGNLTGKLPNLENNPEYIDIAIKKGFFVEIDLRTMNGKLFLGHDAPQYEINYDWLKRRSGSIWVHCKDKDALEYCLNNNLHCFWHDTDDYTITNRGYIWAYPGKESAGPLCIMVMPERVWPVEEIKNLNTFGVCSDFVELINT